jgi:hypothetical protein
MPFADNSRPVNSGVIPPLEGSEASTYRMRRTTDLLLFLLLLGVVGAPQMQGSGATDKNRDACPVHHTPLKREKLEIVYGLVLDPCNTDRRARVAEKHFPYANSVVYGGCVIFPDSPTDKEVTYCSKCREVEKTWPCLETRDTPIATKLSRRGKKRTVRP